MRKRVAELEFKLNNLRGTYPGVSIYKFYCSAEIRVAMETANTLGHAVVASLLTENGKPVLRLGAWR